MKTVTVEDVMRWKPCYSEGEVRELAAGRERWSALDMIDELPGRGVSADDIFWLVLREKLIDAMILRLFAADCADRALLRERAAGREPAAASWAAVEVARRYARGQATDAELAAVARATGAAAAVVAAAEAAAWEAWSALSAGAAAAWSALSAAAEAAEAWDTEWAWQVAHLRELLVQQESETTASGDAVSGPCK